MMGLWFLLVSLFLSPLLSLCFPRNFLSTVCSLQFFLLQLSVIQELQVVRYGEWEAFYNPVIRLQNIRGLCPRTVTLTSAFWMPPFLVKTGRVEGLNLGISLSPVRWGFINIDLLMGSWETESSGHISKQSLVPTTFWKQKEIFLWSSQ